MPAIRLWTATLSVAMLALAGSASSFAEEAKDAVKAEPTHYKLAFENDTVAVVNIHYGAHEKSKLHSHPGGVVVALTPGHLRFTDEEGKTREVQTLRGEARWFPPLKHTVENLGNTAYDGVYIEVKQSHKSAENTPAVPHTDIRTSATPPEKNGMDKPGVHPVQSTLVHK